MFFVDDYTLTRSSAFKTLIALFITITVINLIVIQQVYSDSESFHRQQLTQQLNDDIAEFKFAAQLSMLELKRLHATKQASDNHFSYRLVIQESQPLRPAPVRAPIDPTHHFHNPLSEPKTWDANYPVGQLPKQDTKISLSPQAWLDIEVDPGIMDDFKRSLIPIIFSGVLLPIALMLAGALFLSVLVLRRLEQVNRAMNRVLCGERQVKLPVSPRDDEFDILAIHLNYMIEQMTHNEASLKSLTTGLAHDMRTPMARLKLRLEDTLEKPFLTPEQQAVISACHDDLELLLSLFNSMLEIGKLNSLETEITTQPTDLSQIVHDAIEFIAPIAEGKQQTLRVRQDQLCIVNGDRSLLFRAIFNLIENAVKYTPDSGTIEVIVDQFGVVVADDGIGISHQDKIYVCQPMYRADKSRAQQGNGLGLALVAAVAKRHNIRLVLRDNHPGLRARLLFNAHQGLTLPY